MTSEIPFIRPRFPDPADLAQEFTEIVDANWYTNFGPKERLFAESIGKYVGPDLHVATFANGTLALIAAIRAAVGAGDHDRYVLMPSFTFIAAAEAAVWAGYRPWFIDIDPRTWQPSLAAARTALESARDDIAGIQLANVFGVGNPDIDAWEELAAEWGLPLVIDSAAGFGSRYSGHERVGGRGDCEIFSFHATKPFAIGEGGALVTRNPEIASQAHDFENFGFAKSRECTQIGMNAKMQEISAAIGLRQLPGFDRRLASRRSVFECYREPLTALGLQFQPNADTSTLCFASACCSSPDQKASVLNSLQHHGIQARDYYNPPQHRHPYFEANQELTRSTELSVTTDVCSRIVSLPVHDHMVADDIARVISAVRDGSA
jgi:dTDP-4-amino-4,6-dideoxygalactose transaminase